MYISSAQRGPTRTSSRPLRARDPGDFGMWYSALAAADAQLVGRTPSTPSPSNASSHATINLDIASRISRDSMKRYHSPGEALQAARDPTMTAEELRVLATSIFDFVQLAVTEHPNTEPDVLLALLPSVIESWNEQQRADAIARHARTPAAAFRLLAERLPPILNRGRNHQFGLRAGIAFCCNPKTPIGDIEMLIRDTRVSTDFRQMLVREVTRLEVLHLLVTDRSIAVQKRAQARLQELSNIRND